MAGLATLLGDLVRAVIKPTVADLLVDVVHKAEGDPTVTGPTFTSVTRQALYERKQQRIRLLDGTTKVAIGTLTFLDPVTVNAGDQFTLPDGTQGYVLDTGGLETPEGSPVTQVWLGFGAERG
jgi:hypothetical protein